MWFLNVCHAASRCIRHHLPLPGCFVSSGFIHQMQRSLLYSKPVVLRDNLGEGEGTSLLELSLQDFVADASDFAFLALDC